MRPMTAAGYRDRGGIYPRTRGEGWRSYRELLGAPLGDDEALSQLVRFPGPSALRRILREDAPLRLHEDGFDAVFVGDPARIWSWPGVSEFGAVALLDPWSASPVRSTLEGAYLVDARAAIDPEATVYVPDAECCRAIEPAASFGEARALLPPDWRRRLDEALVRIDRYIAFALRVAATREALLELPPDEASEVCGRFSLARADLERPLFRLPPEARPRLLELHASVPHPHPQPR